MTADRYRVRVLEFVGETEFVHGYGMTWDDVVIEIPQGEQIVECKQTWKRGRGFDSEVACVQVWVISPTDEEPTPTEHQKTEPVVVAAPIHTKYVIDQRSRWQKLRSALRHSHYPIWSQWTMDESSWKDDRKAIQICSCGAKRHMWGGEWQ